MSFGAITAIIRPGASVTSAIVGPRGIPGQNGLSITGPAPLTAIAPWQPLQSYVVGPPASFVAIGGSSYACVIPHTSTTFLADFNSGFWATVASIGLTGARGSLWFEGVGVPASSTGAPGDYWFQTDTCDIFTKGSSNWGTPVANIKGAKGDTGAAGNTILNGLTAPTSAEGNNGDFKLVLGASDIVVWGPKASGAWPSSGRSLIGPSGPGTGSVNTSGIATPGHVAVFGPNNSIIQDGGVLGGAAALNVGQVPGTVAAGDDSRFGGALQVVRALIEIAALGPQVQAAARQNIGALSRGRVVALAILN